MKFLLFIFCASLLLPLSAAVSIGDNAPELPADIWYSGKALSLKKNRGKAVVLFFWKVENGDVRHIPAMIKQAQKLPCPAAIIANGMLSILRKMPMNQYIPVPQMADEKGTFLRLYLPESIVTPAAVIIDGRGKIVWRGPFARTAAKFALFQKGKLDLETAKRQEIFFAELAILQKKKEYKKALELIDKELKSSPPNPAELVMIQVGIQIKQFNSLENALKCVLDAQKLFPKETLLYEIELKLLERSHQENKIADFYTKVIRLFPADVPLLLKFLQYETSLSCTKMRPANAYMLARAAWHAPKFRDKKEQGKAALFYAQTLYCCGRVDLALKMAEKAKTLLKGAPQSKGAAELSEFYRKVQKLAPVIKE